MTCILFVNIILHGITLQNEKNVFRIMCVSVSLYRLLETDASEKAWSYLSEILKMNPLLQSVLDLSKNKPGDLGVEKFHDLLRDLHWKLKKLKSVVLFVGSDN